MVADVEEAVKSKLASEGVTTIIHGCFRDVNSFENLEIEYKQSKIYKEYFNLVVSDYHNYLLHHFKLHYII